MFAMRLAREVAHTVDVDGMLAGMTPQQFDEWVAVFSIWHSSDSDDTEPAKGDLLSSLGAMRKLTGV